MNIKHEYNNTFPETLFSIKSGGYAIPKNKWSTNYFVSMLSLQTVESIIHIIITKCHEFIYGLSQETKLTANYAISELKGFLDELCINIDMQYKLGINMEYNTITVQIEMIYGNNTYLQRAQISLDRY